MQFYRILFDDGVERRYVGGGNNDHGLYTTVKGCKAFISTHVKHARNWGPRYESETRPENYHIESWVLTKTDD